VGISGVEGCLLENLFSEFDGKALFQNEGQIFFCLHVLWRTGNTFVNLFEERVRVVGLSQRLSAQALCCQFDVVLGGSRALHAGDDHLPSIRELAGREVAQVLHEVAHDQGLQAMRNILVRLLGVCCEHTGALGVEEVGAHVYATLSLAHVRLQPDESKGGEGPVHQHLSDHTDIKLANRMTIGFGPEVEGTTGSHKGRAKASLVSLSCAERGPVSHVHLDPLTLVLLERPCLSGKAKVGVWVEDKLARELVVRKVHRSQVHLALSLCREYMVVLGVACQHALHGLDIVKMVPPKRALSHADGVVLPQPGLVRLLPQVCRSC